MGTSRVKRLDGVIIIPARFHSSRFPGKPLAKIAGKPMLQRVYEICSSVAPESQIFVATDDSQIGDFCKYFGYRHVLTSAECLTGTDRVAEANQSIQSELVINVQGDEPLIKPEDILRVYTAKLEEPQKVINGYCNFSSEPGITNMNVPKVVMNEKNQLLYISRQNVPYGAAVAQHTLYLFKRQVCIYGFDAVHLERFHGYGRKSEVERIEDIEILRFLELDIQVQMIELHESIAVDVPADIERVESHLKGRL
jgi:3-deoxy-manno-octulosonate cytidylyltransferase (CMP-KDO synthetase)